MRRVSCGELATILRASAIYATKSGEDRPSIQNTGESRRKIDFEVIKDGEVVKSVEVTSETADKTAQLAKEERIRDAGGNYVVDRRTGELVRFAPDVQTEVVRRV